VEVALSVTGSSGVERREIHYRGRVQGVGFRYTARNIARRHAVSGFVRNLPDGRVQMVLEGESGEVEQFLTDVADAMSGNIRDTDAVTSAATGEFDGFDIRF
jgi:acylphosphatase